ncbi:MAG: LacI family DNA-binding transcriptional regulator, partial [Lentisphaeria bacterium]
MKPERRVGITDVARAAGVSCCTVSQTLNGKRPVGAEVRQRVAKAIQKLGYCPNPTARNLVLKRTLQIGVVVDGVTNGIAAVTVESIGRRLHAHGYKTLLALCSDERRQTARAYLREFSSGMVDGVINMMPEIDTDEAKTLCKGVPVVTYRRPPDHPSDIIDIAAASTKVFEHLWSLGHRKIGIFASDECPNVPGSRREDGYRRFFDARGVSPDERLIERMDWVDQDAAPHAA